jgi:hypothetical protein
MINKFENMEIRAAAKTNNELHFGISRKRSISAKTGARNGTNSSVT